MSEPVFESPSSFPTHVRTRSRYLAVAGLLVALLASAAWITLPIGTVPVTLQVFVVVLVALLLPTEWAAATIGVYLLLGTIGAPVFAGGRAGLGVLFGPTGGYLLGFLAGATLGAVCRHALTRLGAKDVIADSAAALVTVLVIYALGWVQLAFVTGSDLATSFAIGVVPFVLIDAAKAAVAVGVASGLRRVGVAGR